MSLGFGHRGRIGHLYPSGGLCDYEIQLMAPEGIQLVTTRLPFPATGIEDDLRLVEDLESHARMLADAQVDIIALNCTAATLLAGPERLNRRITDATGGIESVTTIEAVLAALAETAVRRVALVTPPYPEDVAAAEIEYLRAHGIEVTADIGIPCATPVEQSMIDCSLAAPRRVRRARQRRRNSAQLCGYSNIRGGDRCDRATDRPARDHQQSSPAVAHSADARCCPRCRTGSAHCSPGGSRIARSRSQRSRAASIPVSASRHSRRSWRR